MERVPLVDKHNNNKCHASNLPCCLQLVSYTSRSKRLLASAALNMCTQFAAVSKRLENGKEKQLIQMAGRIEEVEHVYRCVRVE